MRIIQISDTHSKHHLLTKLPPADVVVHCGDITENGTEEEVLDFLNWFIMLPYKHKMFVTGNHDLCLWEATAIEDLPENVHFLQNRECEIEGIKFFGLAYMLKTVDIRSPKTGISVHFSYSLPMAMQIY